MILPIQCRLTTICPLPFLPLGLINICIFPLFNARAASPLFAYLPFHHQSRSSSLNKQKEQKGEKSWHFFYVGKWKMGKNVRKMVESKVYKKKVRRRMNGRVDH